MHLCKPESSLNNSVKPQDKGQLIKTKCKGHTLDLLALKTGDPFVFRVIVTSLHLAFGFSLVLQADIHQECLHTCQRHFW